MIQLVAINSDKKINNLLSGILDKDSIDYRIFATANEGLEFLVSCKPSPNVVFLTHNIPDLKYSELVPIILDNYSNSKCLVLKEKNNGIASFDHQNYIPIEIDKVEQYINKNLSKSKKLTKQESSLTEKELELGFRHSPLSQIYLGENKEIIEIRTHDKHLKNILEFEYIGKQINDYFTVMNIDSTIELLFQTLNYEFKTYQCRIQKINLKSQRVKEIYYLLEKDESSLSVHNELLDKMLIVNDITRSISSFLNFEDFVNQLCTHIQTIFTPDLTEFYAIKDGEELVLVQQVLKNNDTNTVVETQFTEPDLVFIAEKLEDFVLSINLCDKESHKELKVYQEYESLFILPVYDKDNIISLICLASAEKDIFSDADVSSLEVLSDIVSIALQNINLYNDLHIKNKDMEAVISDLQIAKESIEEQALYLSQLLEETESSRQIIEQQNKEKEEELKKAAELQNNLLPERIVEHPNVIFESIYKPCTEVAGDIYDVVELENGKIGIVIADVSDHGASSAMIAAMFKMVFTIYSKMYDSPKKVFEEMNSIMNKTITTGDYVTAFYTIFDPSTFELTYSSAGHPELLLVDKDGGNKRLLETNGFFIGMFDFSDYEEKKIKIDPGDHILFYTDGIYEIKNEELDEYSKEKLWDTFVTAIQEFSLFPLSVVLSDSEKFAGNQQIDDDITMIHANFLEK